MTLLTFYNIFKISKNINYFRKRIDTNVLAENEDTLIKDPNYPFEKIEIWQYLHALIEVSWHLYTKLNDTDVEDMNGQLAAGLHKLLKCDIYPHVGYHVGMYIHIKITN